MTIEELQKKICFSYLWEKHGLKRLYVDFGYNTKKMKTTTYIYQNIDGDFIVNCRIICPSQPCKWIETQEAAVENEVYELIKNIQNENQDC